MGIVLCSGSAWGFLHAAFLANKPIAGVPSRPDRRENGSSIRRHREYACCRQGRNLAEEEKARFAQAPGKTLRALCFARNVPGNPSATPGAALLVVNDHFPKEAGRLTPAGNPDVTGGGGGAGTIAPPAGGGQHGGGTRVTIRRWQPHPLLSKIRARSTAPARTRFIMCRLPFRPVFVRIE
jgi:hypothetical protein